MDVAMRYPHYITSPEKETWPSSVLCVSAETTLYQTEDTCEQSMSALVAWHAKCVSVLSCLTLISASKNGNTLAGFWEYLYLIAKGSNRVLVLSDDCGAAWHYLRFWDMLEDGEISIADRNHRCQAQRRNSEYTGFSGYLCIEDPPNVAKFRLGDLSRPVTWVDIRNYGVDVPDEITDAEERVEWLANWFVTAAQIVRDCGLGSWCNTVGSQALHGWRKSYLSHGVYAHVHPQALALEAAAYYGGRCEAYRLGALQHTMHQFDYRSMYPSICVAHNLPVRLRDYSSSEFTTYAIADRYAEQAIAEVTIETDTPDYPYRTHIPLGNEHANGMARSGCKRAVCDTEIIYPAGRFVTTLCGPEFTRALRKNHVRDIHSIACYDMEPALLDFADKLYTLRCRGCMLGVGGIEQYIKSLLVSLPGKLGQRERIWLDCPDVSTDQRYGTWWGTDKAGTSCRYRAIAGIVQRDVRLGFSPNAVPAIAGFITSFGRTRLSRAIDIAGVQRVVYCDTDAIITDDTGRNNLMSSGAIHENTLGELRHVCSSDYCNIYGVKHYEIGSTSRNSGVPRWCRDSADSECKQKRHRRISEDIYSGTRPNNGLSISAIATPSSYRHRVTSDDGTTRPWVVRDGELY
jgi:DNA polymerase type B, organellar and viral